ncbi:uncharacterized protein BXZ73DRAFT_74844 [Epithele typhae]|uniref:uncharacterized protein n=1 Tax=Epithele typhae TaxID=378194 RepID=UPI002007CD70|nr:uncharacterized protein BXZ73DRAFT_74844 [Epithele typhae]KAH9941632.1 hypothetical protein BXZ73DRAFT_74844 [Epithele typhae]
MSPPSKPPLTVRDLPTDLFRHILDHLGCDVHETLSACTLVCRDWLNVSRQHLFAELHVLRGADESFQDLVDFLDAHPVHAACVRTLQLEARLFSFPFNVPLMPTIDLDVFARISRALPGLQNVRMRQVRIAAPGGKPLPPLPNPPPRRRLDHMEYEKCYGEIAPTFEFLAHFQYDHLDFCPIFPDTNPATIRAGPHALLARSVCLIPVTPNPHVVVAAMRQVTPPETFMSFRWPTSQLSDPQVPVAALLQDIGQNLVDVHLGPSERDAHLALPHLPRLQTFRYSAGVSLLAPPSEMHAQRMQFASFFRDFLPLLPADLQELVLYVQWSDDEGVPHPRSHSHGPSHGAGAARALVPGEATMPMWGADAPTMERLKWLKWLTLCMPAVPEGDVGRATAEAAKCFPKAHAHAAFRVSVVVWELECREHDIYDYLSDC